LKRQYNYQIGDEKNSNKKWTANEKRSRNRLLKIELKALNYKRK
jgi:hypothetical protein